jgi:phosphate transport system substrate-binding protein
MDLKLKLSLILLICILIAGCSTLATGTIPPSPQPVQVAFPPSLEPVREALATCAKEYPQIVLIIDTRSGILDFEDNDITIWWGDKPLEVNQAFPLAQDELVVIANRDNPIQELTANELANLFNGRVEQWSEINDYQGSVSVWTYTDGSQLGKTFRSAILGDGGYSLLSHLAPTPREMVAAVVDDPGAIGFIPRSWLTSEVAAIELDSETAGTLIKPLLALTKVKPQGAALILIDCLQSGVGQSALFEQFSPLK